MTAFFITSTGTEIGKTFVTAALAHQLRAQGRTVDAIKPIMTGCSRAAMGDSDAAVLLRSLGHDVTEEAIVGISPFRFSAPLAPSMAARAEGRPAVGLKDLVDFCARRKRKSSVLLVEGIGGVMVPISGRVTVLDWISALGAPVILVAGSYLGTLSHLLTAIEALRARPVRIAGVVVSETRGSTVSLADSAAEIRDLVDFPVVPLPWIAGDEAWRRAGGLTALLNLSGDTGVL
jgi:dethiobiotin synthetase